MVLVALAATACAASAADAGSSGGAGLIGYGGSPSGAASWITASASTTTANGVGGPCTQDADCVDPLKCALENSDYPVFGGGPSGGMCTMTCAADGDCPSPMSLCYQPANSALGLCVLSCQLGASADGGTDGGSLSATDLVATLDPNKCLGRNDLRCTNTSVTGRLACLPACGSDAVCNGRVCDPRLAVCVDGGMADAGDTTGASCDPDPTAMTTTCAGQCISFRNAAIGMCSSPCVLGSTASCGGLDSGLCAFHPLANGAGDSGFCTRECSAHTDCNNSNFWCFGVSGLAQGYCFVATACPDGQCDAAYTCTPTSYGPYCLDPQYGGDIAATADAGAGPADAGSGVAAPDSGGTGGGGAGGRSTTGVASTMFQGNGGAGGGDGGN